MKMSNNMKKTFITAVLCLAMSATATAQTLRVADVYAVPGSQMSVGITVDVNGGEYKGFQMSMKFPDEGFTLPTSNKTKKSDKYDGTVSANMPKSTTAKVTGLGLSAIPNGEFLIAVVNFNVAGTMAAGDYVVTLSSMKLSNGATSVKFDNQSFTIHVVDHPVLDENSTVAPQAINTNTTVTVNRSLTANEWGTLCLPFGMTAAQAKTAFGDGVRVADFKGYTKEGNNITVQFEDVDLANGIEANHPYIVKASKTVESFTVEGVTVTPEDAVVTVTDTNDPSKESTFTGTYQAGTTIPYAAGERGLFLSEGALWYATSATKKMKAFRGYFLLAEEVSGSNMAMAVSNETTGISEMEKMRDVDNETVYNLAGQRVAQPTKGLYIVNGRKVVNNNK